MKKLMFILVAVLFVSIPAISQVQALYGYAVEGLGTGLLIEEGSVFAGPLYAGVCYEITPDPQGLLASGGVTPVTVDEAAEIAPSVITGDPFSDVMISCSVPTLLLSDDGFAPLALTYTATSGLAWFPGDGTNGVFFNPTAGPIDVNLDADGATEVWIGFNTCMPKYGLAAAAWVGEGLISVQYK
jgi:hypothetical protein